MRLSKRRKFVEGSNKLVNLPLKIGQTNLTPGSDNFYLDEASIAAFEKDGILGPFDVISEQEATRLKDFIYTQEARNFDNVLYIGDAVERILRKHDDLSINYTGLYQALRIRPLYDLLLRPEITHRLASLFGENVICWRSQFFEKKPGSVGTFWHQNSVFRENSKQNKLFPTKPIAPPMVQLTAWIALTNVTKENGALRIVPGSYKDGRMEYIYSYAQDNVFDFLSRLPRRNVKQILESYFFTAGSFTKTQAIFNAAEEYLNQPYSGNSVRDLTMKAGQAIIFTTLNMHGSYPNVTTDDTRLAFAGRFTTNDVKVYPGIKQEDFPTAEGNVPYSLESIYNIQAHGQDNTGFNKMLKEPPQGGLEEWRKML